MMSIPSTVEQAYEKVLGRICKEDESTVRKILQIVVGARRPLSIGEMAIAMGIATSTNLESLETARVDLEGLGDRIRDWCGLFVFLNHSRIYLIHQTAKEFLVREGDLISTQSSWKQCLNLTDVEKEMARICVEFLCLKGIGFTAQSLIRQFEPRTSIDDILKDDNDVEHFLAYSAWYWPNHLKNAVLPTNDPLMSIILRMYDTTSAISSQWFTIFWQIFNRWMEKPQINKIRLAALLGHDKVLEAALQEPCSDVNVCDDDGRMALAWASECGHEQIVRLLLEAGADINAGGYLDTALQQASGEGHEQIVRLLLQSGADINTAGRHYGTALQEASRRGHQQVVRLLLAAGAIDLDH